MDIKAPMIIKRELTHWKPGGIDKQVWSEHARQGTVLIDRSEEGARALLVDDYGGVRAAFRVPPGQLDEVIAAAARSWLERHTTGSFAVFTSDQVKIGTITPPTPPPPPGPGGHDRIIKLQAVAGHAVLNAAVELARQAEH